MENAQVEETHTAASTSPVKSVRPKRVTHQWDTDDDSLPRIFEIFSGRYTSFKMDLRRLYVNTQGISQNLEGKEECSLSVYDYKLR